MKLAVKEEVYDDILEIVKWYELQLQGLGKKFLDEWYNELELVAKTPFSYQIKNKEFREARIKGFPYLIIFEIDPDEVVVYAVIHARRNPRKRYKRK